MHACTICPKRDHISGPIALPRISDSRKLLIHVFYCLHIEAGIIKLASVGDIISLDIVVVSPCVVLLRWCGCEIILTRHF